MDEYLRLKEIIIQTFKGGFGSGFFGHSGRPGLVGGSINYAPHKDSGATWAKGSAQQRANSLQANYQNYLNAGIPENEIKSWEDAGFGWRSAPGWRNAGFTAEEAKSWREIGGRDNPVMPDEAAWAKREYKTPEKYKYSRNRTYPHPMQTR